MAHIIEVPVEFNFEVLPAVWRIGIAKPAGWLRSTGGLMLEIIEPAAYRGYQSSVSDNHLPQLLDQVSAYVKRYEPWRIISHPSDRNREASLSQEIERDFGHYRIELLLCDLLERDLDAQGAYLARMGLTPADLPTKKKKTDAWELRDEFLRVRRNIGDLARFLNRWGSWSWENELRGFDLSSNKPGDGPSFVFADSIWSDQDVFATALRSDPSAWFSHKPLGGGFETRGEFPHFVHRVSTCQAAIGATITFDFVQGSKFRLCALKDCRVPFKLESDHKRKFCSQYHAHLASVRRNRKLAKPVTQTKRR